MASQWLHPGWKTDRRGRPAGFTLVELLTVIVIIGILVGLTTGVVIGARTRAAQAGIAMEISNMDTALRAYADKYGEFPPDFMGINSTAGRNLVLRHLARVFPRYVPGEVRGNSTSTVPWTRTSYNDLASLHQLQSSHRAVTRGTTMGMKAEFLDPASALVFWLGGTIVFHGWKHGRDQWEEEVPTVSAPIRVIRSNHRLRPERRERRPARLRRCRRDFRSFSILTRRGCSRTRRRGRRPPVGRCRIIRATRPGVRPIR